MMSFLSRVFIQKQLLSALCKGSIQSHTHRELFCYVRPCTYCPHLHIRCVGTSTVIKASRNPEDVVERRSFLGKKKKKQIVVKDFRDPVVIYPDMPANELADQLNISRASLFTTLNNITGINEFTEEGPDTVNLKMATKAVKMYGRQMKMKETVKDKDESPKNDDIPPQKPPDPSVLVPRPSIVTIMGHVDHGKTTLLDALRKTNVVDTEFGGITQHIGAFQVKLPGGYAITFLDTPGHAAFTAMRARGASVTDIIVLVVAADDGLMQQTIEAINLARNENVPLIVAINKVDKVDPEKVEKVKFLLSQHGVQVEDMGGDVQAVPISALKGTNLDQLQECIVTLAEYMDLKADPQGHVEATVIESRSDPGKGKITTAIIQRGTLKKGDLILAGLSWAKVRALYNDQGAVINEAPPSTPVTVSGWKTLPDVGDMIVQASSEKQLKAALAYRSAVAQEEKIAADSMVIEEKRKEHHKQYTAIREEKVTYRKHMPIPVFLKRTKGITFKEQEEEDNTKPHLPVIIKGDVSGSVEAIVDTLAMFHSDMCTLDIMSYGVGDVTEQDVRLADSFKGVIYAFNVSVSKNARDLQLDVDIRHHKVIYSLFEDLVSNLNHILPPVKEEEIVGEAKIQQVFYVTEKKQKIAVAGCRCIMGTMKKRLNYRVMRNDQVIYEGQLASLKHHKEEVEEIKTNVECGLRLDTSDIMFEVNDIVVCYHYVEKPQTLDWQPDFT